MELMKFDESKDGHGNSGNSKSESDCLNKDQII